MATAPSHCHPSRGRGPLLTIAQRQLRLLLAPLFSSINPTPTCCCCCFCFSTLLLTCLHNCITIDPILATFSSITISILLTSSPTGLNGPCPWLLLKHACTEKRCVLVYPAIASWDQRVVCWHTDTKPNTRVIVYRIQVRTMYEH